MINFNISWVRGFFNDGIHDFFLKDGTKKQVEMFVADSLCQFVENDDFYLFGEFLIDGSSLLYIILPKENKTLENILEKLETEQLYNLIRFAEAEVKKIRIPKFIVESETDLSERLRKMEMEFVFDSQEWNFDNVCENYENLHISSILQNLSINVNVKGIGDNIIHENEPLSEEGVHEITVDRPFVYMLVTKCRGVMWTKPEHFNIILTGIVCDPTQNT
uniref:Serpin domain-containing protein n=1 Tax=Panagrolaimus sp. JU765 TaxID=591449 RepID=A0AC34RRV3_9BILA